VRACVAAISLLHVVLRSAATSRHRIFWH
jgi:hypothetical protein